MLNLKFKIRIILWSILGLVIGWVLYMAIVPGGRISYSQDFADDNYFIRKLTPLERVADGENSESKLLIGDPVYFSLRTSRTFNFAKLTIKYRRDGEKEFQFPAGDWNSLAPIIEAGVLVDKTVWRHDLQPIENRIIDQLSLVWDVTEAGGAMLLQREKKYNTFEEFLGNLPEQDEVAVYNYDLNTDYILDTYVPRASETDPESVLPYPLRGAYQFYTYIKDEDLNFDFIFQDLNQNKDADPIDIFLYYSGELIDSRHMDDDGVSQDLGEVSTDKKLKFEAASLPEGVYKIEIKANSDIVTKEIYTTQSKIAFVNKIRFLKDSNENINLYTDSRSVQALTIHPDRLQTIKVGNSELILDKTYTQFLTKTTKATSSDKYVTLELDKDGVEISGDGVFSFSTEELINPRMKRVDEKLDIDSINYVLAGYRSPHKEGEWSVASATFDIAGAYRESGQYSFIISIPGLLTNDGIDNFVEVSSIKVDLVGKTLWQKMREVISRIGN